VVQQARVVLAPYDSVLELKEIISYAMERQAIHIY
jgi:hypothetical protein